VPVAGTLSTARRGADALSAQLGLQRSRSPADFVDLRDRRQLAHATSLVRDVLCRDLTILPNVTLTTNGHSIFCSGSFVNRGTIVTGFVPAQDLPESYGGSGGGGGARCGGAGGENGRRTMIEGGYGFSHVTDGGTPIIPSLTNDLLNQWFEVGLGMRLSGAAGGGDPFAGSNYTGTPGAYGLYLQARRIAAGRIRARAPDACDSTRCDPGSSRGGGGGGVIVLAYGEGGYTPGEYDVSGGTGNPTGCYPSGHGGDGRIIALQKSVPPISLPQIVNSAPRVRRSADCLAEGTSTIGNSARGWLTIEAGSGPFAGLSRAKNTLVVHRAETLAGTLRVQSLRSAQAPQIAPMIGTTSWGTPSTSWFTVASSVGSGSRFYDVPVKVAAPRNSGAYHVVFSFQAEPAPVYVASGTDYVVGHAEWSQHNAAAELDKVQLLDMQRYGCAIVRRTMIDGFSWFYQPGVAIKIVVL